MPASLAHDLKALVKGAVADDAATREAKSADFGRMLRRVPGVVVRPASADDVAAVIRYARKHAVPVATRGEAHTQTGQSLTDGGILLDLTALDRIHRVDAGGGANGPSADCDAGVTWETLVKQVVPQGLIPPVLTNNLGVTIGGTLSVAGLGVASFRHGAQGDNVTEIEAVTKDQGRFLGYVRAVGRRRGETPLDEHCWPDTLKTLVPPQYARKPLLRSQEAPGAQGRGGLTF